MPASSGTDTEAARRAAALSRAERGRAVLAAGILAFRWVTLALMALVAVIAGDLRRPWLAAAAVALTAAWTAWLTVARRRGGRWVPACDLLLAIGLNVVSGLVVAPGQVTSHPFFASGYPIAAAAFWGARFGFRGGVGAGVAVGASLVGSHLANGIDLAGASTSELVRLATGSLNFVLAGGAVGLVAGLLERSAQELRGALATALEARERAARLAERESLARQIHDSVLQALALVHKQGRELAGGGPVPADEVARLAEVAGSQERALRNLVLRPLPDGTPRGTASLRDRLEALARSWPGLPVTITATGPLWLPGHEVDELAAAVRQALDNVAEHAGAAQATVLAEEDGAGVLVTVRDDGVGFSYNEAALAAGGKIGLLKSVRGRVEQLGGNVLVRSAPGAGTEIELRLPVRADGNGSAPGAAGMARDNG